MGGSRHLVWRSSRWSVILRGTDYWERGKADEQLSVVAQRRQRLRHRLLIEAWKAEWIGCRSSSYDGLFYNHTTERLSVACLGGIVGWHGKLSA